MEENSVVSCVVNIEWQNAQGTTVKKVSQKQGTLRIIRNEMRQLYIEVSSPKATPILLSLRGITVHKKFMTEGKASLKFPECSVFLSNAPPGILVAFLKTLFIKMSGEKPVSQAELQKKIRAHFLSEKPSSFEDISPITDTELMRAKKLALSKSTLTTPSPPSRKKRSADGTIAGPAPKKLYSSASQPTQGRVAGVTRLSDSESKLNTEQKEVLQACLQGRNVFFTGSAGTGKSYLLKKIIAAFPPEGTVATASTGVAACILGGVTLHSFAGIGSGSASLNRCYELASKPAVASTWRKCKRLVIDEISMVDGGFFEKIEAVARFARSNDKPFGGIQLILCGDFLQLPPVVKSNGSVSQGGEQTRRFCFQTAAWEKCIQQNFELKEVHRQKDSEFVKILNCLRIGRATPEIAERLMRTAHQTVEANGILATQLCSHTKDADAINSSKLENISAEPKVFSAIDSDASMTQLLDSQVLAPGKLTLKIGAQVMLLKNISVQDGLVNGARGVVQKYVEGYPLVRFKSRKEYLAKPEKWSIKTPGGNIVTRKQVPLKLAWAISIHKSQGLTLDCVEMSLGKVFEAGQAYVALSRAKSLDSLRVLDFEARQVWANPEVLKFYLNFRRQLHNQTYIPLGRSQSSEGDSRERLKKALSGLSKKVRNQPLMTIN